MAKTKDLKKKSDKTPAAKSPKEKREAKAIKQQSKNNSGKLIV